MDATTEGKPGIERGVYSLTGNTLEICLATDGGDRPREFVTATASDQILIRLRRSSGPTSQESNQTSASKKRRFQMGFTGFVYDITLDAVTNSRRFVKENADLLAHHIEGVPWAEALNGRPFPKVFLDEWESKKLATPKHGKVYLAISPGRGELKVAEKASPLPEELAGKAYDHPLVMKAYLNYCRRAVAFFQPDYLSIGIEVNEIHDANPQQWQAYMILHQHVYREIKRTHKKLPIFAS